MTINANTWFYQLIVMPININSAGCALYGCFSQSGFHMTNFEEINFIAYYNYVSGPSVSAQNINKMYKY
jgi:hypothetical protein